MRSPDSRSCRRCAALQAEVVELKRRLSEHEGEPPTLNLHALRLLEHGWGAGWELRPSPARRHWMTENPHAYQCLPMVVANQWGWQVLCPTDVRVTWDGSPEPRGPARRGRSPIRASAIKSQFGSGIVTFSPPWLFRTPPGWDLYAKGPSNRWKAELRAAGGGDRDLVAQLHLHAELEARRAGDGRVREGESLGQLVPVPHATFQGATAAEAAIEVAEPEAAAELLRWREERRRIAQRASRRTISTARPKISRATS